MQPVPLPRGRHAGTILSYPQPRATTVTPLAFFALFGWPLLVTVLFAVWPARRAASVAVIGAWLFLPPYKLPISGLPDYSRNTAIAIGMMMGTLLFTPDRLLRFRPRWFDLPMLAWCLCDIPSSLDNGLGLYDGLSHALSETLTWGIPYLMGRVHFSTPEDLRYFGVAMVIGGLCYVPLCVEEMKMSPNLLSRFYGLAKASWNAVRLGGYRPQVFFWTGLECGMWMTAASLTGWWLWRCGALRRIGPYPFGWLLPILIGTTILCRSTGALALLLMGVLILSLSVRLKTRLLLAGLLLIGPVYVSVRARGCGPASRPWTSPRRWSAPIGRSRWATASCASDCSPTMP